MAKAIRLTASPILVGGATAQAAADKVGSNAHVPIPDGPMVDPGSIIAVKGIEVGPIER
jgi:hypothetical protein